MYKDLITFIKCWYQTDQFIPLHEPRFKKIDREYVLDAIEQSGTDSLPVVRTKEFEALSEAVEKFSDAMQTHPANRLLKDI